MDNISNQQNFCDDEQCDDDYVVSRSLLTLLAPKPTLFDGPTLSIADRLRRYVPFRKIGTLATIDHTTGFFTFTLSADEDQRNYAEFAGQLNEFYSEAGNRCRVSRAEVVTDRDFVCESADWGGGYYRCRIVEENTSLRPPKDDDTCEVFLFDLGRFTNVGFNNLFALDSSFNQSTQYYAFTLKCSSLDARTLQRLGLPSLDHFRVGNIVEVLICSIHEPCLGIIGSVSDLCKRIRPETMLDGFDVNAGTKWISLVTSIERSLLPMQRQIKDKLESGDFMEEWQLVTIAGMHSIENFSVRDAATSIRLITLQKYLNDLYECQQHREQLRVSRERYFKFRRGMPLVIFDGAQYFRAKVHSICVEHELLDIECIDFPHLHFHGLDFGNEALFMLSQTFDLPAQCFSICLDNERRGGYSRTLSLMARHYVNVGSVAFVRSFRGAGGCLRRHILEFADEQPDLLTVLRLSLADEKRQNRIVSAAEKEQNGCGDEEGGEEQSVAEKASLKSFPRNALRPLLKRLTQRGSPECTFTLESANGGEENEDEEEKSEEEEEDNNKDDDQNGSSSDGGTGKGSELCRADDVSGLARSRFSRKTRSPTPPRAVEAISEKMSGNVR